jgi:hypothetical protein
MQGVPGMLQGSLRMVCDVDGMCSDLVGNMRSVLRRRGCFLCITCLSFNVLWVCWFITGCVVSTERSRRNTNGDPVQDVETQARNAKEAASSAKDAAHVANQVAAHSIDITHHAQTALKHARNALHGARVETSGLSSGQKEALRKAEEKLKAATQTADYGSLKDAKYADKLGVKGGEGALDSKLGKLQNKLDASEGGDSVGSMRSQLRSLREELAAKKLQDKTVDTQGTAAKEDDVSVQQMEQEVSY